MCVLLPHHLPEVIDSGIQTTLASDVGLGALIWTDQIVLYIVGVDIVRSRDIWVPSLEDDSRVIKRQDVLVSILALVFRSLAFMTVKQLFGFLFLQALKAGESYGKIIVTE